MPKLSHPRAVLAWFNKYVNAPKYKSVEDLNFTASDGVKLHAVRIAGPPDCGATVVLSHGFANWHRHPKIHEMALQLAEHVNVLVLDLRGHGYSGGTSTLGALEYLDVTAAVQQVPDDDALILLGTSMGAAASVICAGLAGRGDGGRKADAVIAVSGPAWWGGRDSAKGVSRVLELAASPLMRVSMKYLMRVRIAGMRHDGRFDPVGVVGDIAPAPVIIIHDKHDWYFGVDQAEAMAKAAGPTGQLWWREGGHATDLFNQELCDELIANVIAPVMAKHDGSKGDGRGVVEVANTEVAVERDLSVGADVKPASLHIPNTPILGT